MHALQKIRHVSRWHGSVLPSLSMLATLGLQQTDQGLYGAIGGAIARRVGDMPEDAEGIIA